MPNNKRYTGSATSRISYNVSDYHPLDTRQLVPSYDALLLEDNWKYEGELNAYNGMIVAVGNDEVKNGVYYLFDINNPGAEDYPDVTNPANWHKLKLDSDVDGITEEQLNKAIDDLKKELETIYVKNDDAFKALKTSVGNNEDAIATLIGTENDNNKSVRNITKEEISNQLKDTESDLGGLVLRIGSAEEAIKALQGGIISEEDLYATLLKFEANVLIDDSDEISVDERKLKINQVGISKLYTDIDLILHGGSAKA